MSPCLAVLRTSRILLASVCCARFTSLGSVVSFRGGPSSIRARCFVGATRVSGVHYPSDVIGGWVFGFTWASICWLAAEHYDSARGTKR